MNCAQFGLVQRGCEEGDMNSRSKDKNVINPGWILLDTCSTVSVCCNPDLVRDIRKCKEGEMLTIVTNGGKQIYDEVAMMKDFPLQVHFNRESLANIISFRDVANIPGVVIKMDSSKERAITVEMGSYKKFKFLECPDGLYHYDTTTMYENCSKTKSAFVPYLNSSSYSLAMTVEDNKKYFTKREIAGAEGAHRLQQKLGWPSIEQFRHIIAHNLVRNSHINVDDIDRAQYLFGTPTPLLQGKMTRSPNPKERVPRVSIPPAILTHHRNVILHVDFFFVNKLPFLHTKSEGLNFLTVQTGHTRTKEAIAGGLEKVINTYHMRGFKVKTIHGDGEFDLDYLWARIMPINLEITGRDEHDGVVERSVRVIKERARCICHSLPYKFYTRLMTNSLVENVINLLNAFPFKNGVSQTMGPSTIVLGKPAPDVSRKTAIFGSYVMGFLKTKNDMTERSEQAISLGTLNDSGTHYFMSLKSGKKIKCHRWEELPITKEVIERVEDLAREESQQKLVKGFPLFEWEDGREVEGLYDDIKEHISIEDYDDCENEDDSDYAASEASEADIEDQVQQIEEVEDNVNIERNENVITDNEDSEVDDENNKKMNEETNDNFSISESDMTEGENDYEMSETDQESNDKVSRSETSDDDVTKSELGEIETENNEEQPLRRTTRINAGTGVQRTHPFVQFAMKDKKIMRRKA